MGNEAAGHSASGVAPVTFSNTEAPEPSKSMTSAADRDAVTRSPFSAEAVALGRAAE
ncbi:hypothetical protein [Amycolatopsis magusensis]|uniref:Uncharacterized protein n=1 Tax=Amycolatopsis magusensis TaxID=882444 RepID=A0ABS4PL39_9PSEU|nr:hypothetical protein [Amycolatopsis magusensis]MBP2180154.1 hypothetical protein [Amycolatopsis magusensis]MDI5981467.1 hypothetical protein [Amycolatopsis magusensis]